MIRPCWSLVRALNDLQKSMMFTPAWPRAGPTGGAGVAAPAEIWSFTIPTTFLAIPLPYPVPGLQLLHLGEVELDGRVPAEDRHHDSQRAAVEVDVLDHAGEVVERPVDDLDRLALLEHVLRLG